MTKIRGIRYLSYVGTGYCPKCGLWGYFQKWQSYLTKIYDVGSVQHKECIEGKEFTVKRCWL